ncbi:MAG: type II toxin-antitoxin system VapC family toxin [Acidimicrobiales bacterium]
MTRCYLDTNFLYAQLRAPRRAAPAQLESWRARTLTELGDDSGVISALVIDELAYRLVLGWLRDRSDRDPLSTYRTDPGTVTRSMRRRLATTWRALDALDLELEPTDRRVVDDAKALMGSPGLAPRDAFHTAHAQHADCAVIVSSNSSFDRVRGLRRLGP